ncbi:TlpA disulfide reductase family protein [Ideonella sp. BN130291]|uniref:TlpA disulfide reductase family protein n=1 Tax=Ideonella sp. BN130291 TaxID=3112940 RepID=UPI002E26C1BC|nr:TlpA disulfide reductase family protein [Ideonella sp. BN130291]
MKLSPRILTAAAVVVALGVGGALTYKSLNSYDPVPAVNYTLLDGTQGNTAQLRGKVTLVNFWATSCSTCVHEMPQIVATHQKYKARGFDTLAVAMSYDPPAYVANFAESRKLPFKVAIDNTGDIAKGFGDVRLTPTTYVVNKRGEIVKRFVGEPDFNALHVLLEQLLAERA